MSYQLNIFTGQLDLVGASGGGGGGGTVTSVSVVTANGLAGSVMNPTTNASITFSTTVTGLLKGNGTAISAAVAGTDYQVPLTFADSLVNTSSTITLVNDVLAPGNNYFYGTNGSGVKGFFPTSSIIPSGFTPNTFAGFSSIGALESIPGWSFSNTTNGANVNVTTDPFLVSTTLQNFSSDFSPSANAAHDESGYSFLTTFDGAHSNFDNAATITGVSVGQVMSGNGTLDYQRALIVDQHSGNGSSTGVVPIQNAVEIYSEITSGSTVVDATGILLQYNQNGVSTGGYTGLNASVNNQAIGTNLTGLSFIANSAVGAQSILLELIQNGAVGDDLQVITSNNQGAISTDYFGLSFNNQGAIANNNLVFNYDNQSSGTIGNDFLGINFVNSATVGHFFTGSNITNSGTITKGAIGYNLDNTGNVGDGSGVGLFGLNVNLHGGSMAGSIAGLNMFNQMPVTTNDNINGVNVNNSGAGYRFAGVEISNNSNQTEEIKGFSYNSTGNSRTHTAIDVNAGGTVTNDFNLIRATANGSAQNINGLNIDLSGVTSPNQKNGISVNDGSLNVGSNYDTGILSATPGEFQLNDVGGTFHIASGHAMSGSFGFGNNLGITILAEDNMAADLILGGESLGFSINGFVDQLAVVSGKTVDTINYMTAGGGIDPSSTGGTITNMSLFRALGFLPEGGTLNITNLYGFKADTFLGAIGAANEWGFWAGSPTSDNWFNKNVIIGGSTGQPSAAGVGLELGPSRSLRIDDFAAEGVLLNNATGDVRTLPGTSTGDVLTWNGTSWVSSPPATPSGDIPPTTWSGLANNTANQNITGLLFAGTVSSFDALVYINISATANTFTTVKLTGTSDGTSWSTGSVQSEFSGDPITGLDFNITSGGQVQISIGNISGFSAGTVKFRAIAL